MLKLDLKSNPVYRVQPQSLSDKTAMEKKYNCPINECPPTKKLKKKLRLYLELTNVGPSKNTKPRPTWPIVCVFFDRFQYKQVKWFV